MTDGEESKGPYLKCRVGRFQIGLWKREKILPARPDGFAIERKVEIERISVQYSRFDRTLQKWENQTIWCHPIELRDLANAMDEWNEVIVR